MISFDKIVKKMYKIEGKIISLNEIGKIINPDFGIINKNNLNLIYKTIYRLKALNLIKGINKNLYFVNNGKIVRDVDIIDDYYWDILKKIIQENTGNDYFIGNFKALEILIKDFSIPYEIIIYNKEFDKTVYLNKNYKIIFNTIKGSKKNGSKNLFQKFIKYSKIIQIGKNNFKCSNEELSLLDSFLIRNKNKNLDLNLISKFIQKYSIYFNKEAFGELVSLKYITSINRLRDFAKKRGDNDLHRLCIDIIKINGGNCFLTIK